MKFKKRHVDHLTEFSENRKFCSDDTEVTCFGVFVNNCIISEKLLPLLLSKLVITRLRCRKNILDFAERLLLKERKLFMFNTVKLGTSASSP